MGSHTSSRANLDDNTLNKNQSAKMIDSEYSMKMETLSNDVYDNKDIKMESSENTKSVSGRSTSKETLEKGSEISDLKIPTLFEWNEGGDSVFITGSFCGWAHKFPMTQISEDNFKLILNLPRGNYQYKFIVNGQWKFSTQLPIYKDDIGNINNYIDNTNYVIGEKNKKDNDSVNSNSPLQYQPQQNQQQNNSHHHRGNNNKMLIDNFSNTFPSKTQLNTDSPVVPYHYAKLLNLNYNSNQPNIGEMSFIPRKMDLPNENNAATSITFPSHVILNHLFSKIKRKRYIKTCGTLRVRAKFSTFIYIKPM